MPTGLLLDLFFEEAAVTVSRSVGIPIEWKATPVVVSEGSWLGGGGAPPWWYYNFGPPQQPQEHLHPERVKKPKRRKRVASVPVSRSELLVLATKNKKEIRRAAHRERLIREDEEILLLV